MNGSAAVKVARLAANLAAHPGYIAPYLSDYTSRRSPLELEKPWFSYSAIRFLDQFVKPRMLIYEYGSGGSTLYFAKRSGCVVSIEDNKQWYDRVSCIVHERAIKNVEVRFTPADLSSLELFQASGYPDALPKEPADIVVVDGSELDDVQVRPSCFAVAETRIKTGGVIIVDDSWRYPQLRRHNHAKKVQTCQSVGPARPGVTSTDLFFY
jgi:predicted O-methyltransferase YrrM